MATFNAGSIEATLDLDLDPFQSGLRVARALGEGFGKRTFTAALDVRRTKFERSLGVAVRQAEKFAARTYTANLGVNTTAARGNIAAIQKELAALGKQRATASVRIDGAAGALATMRALNKQLDRFDGRHARARVSVDGMAGVIADLRAARRALDDLDGRHARSSASTSTSSTTSGAAGAAGAASALGGAIGGAAGKMQLLIALGISLAPALIPAFTGAAAAAGALVSVLGVVGLSLGALGAAVIGNVTGVLGAQKDLTAANAAVEAAGQQAAAAQQGVAAAQAGVAAATRGVAAAQRGVADAQRAVQDAEQGLAQARQAAAAAVANAERQLGSAVRAAQDAQEGLNDARQAAAERLADYRDQLKGAALDEEAAELAVRRARQTLQDALEDPTSTKLDKDEARQALAEALFSLEQVRESRDELQEQAKRDRKAGVEGSDEVKDARDRLADANRGVADAQRGVAEARQQGAQQIAAAERQVEDAQRGVADANRGVADAQRNLADAQGQAAQAAAVAADAQKALREAESDRAAAQNKLATPAAQAFLRALDGVKEAWGKFLELTQPAALGVATQFLDILAEILPMLAPVANAAAEGVGALLDRFDAWATGGGMSDVVDFLVKWAPGMIESFGVIVGNLVEWFGHIASAFAPFAQEMLDALEDITQGWADWADNLSGSERFASFLDFVRETGPEFLAVMGDIGGAFRNIGEALAPAAMPMLQALGWFFGGIADMDPAQLRLLMLATGALLAFTVAPVAGAALALVAVVAAISDMGGVVGPVADGLETVGDMLDTVWEVSKRLGRVLVNDLKQAWEDLQPTLQDFADYLRDDFQPIWNDFWVAAEPVLRWFIRQAVPMLREGIKFLIGAVRRGMVIFGGFLEFLTGVFTLDFEKAVKGWWTVVYNTVTAIPRLIWDMWMKVAQGVIDSPVGRRIGDLWDRIRTGAKIVKDTVLDTLVRGPDSFLGRLRSGFSTAVREIGEIWDDLKAKVGAPAAVIVDYVYNKGLRPVINAIPGVDNIPTINTDSWPGDVARAKGGVLPGYSPGVDDHVFHSKTAGTLRLSGGEGILIPQATRQLGGERGIEWLNDMARRGVLRKELAEQSHARGGVVYVDGEPMSRLAAAQLAVAEVKGGIPMSVMQGSYQAASPYSGTSHTGGGVMDTSPGTFGAQGVLRKAGFAAWGRNFPGAATAGSGAHVHAVSRYDPEAAGHAQLSSFARGEDGLGGRDYGPNPAPVSSWLSEAYRLSGMSGDLLQIGKTGAGFGNPLARFLEALGEVKDFVKAIPGWIDKLGSGVGGDMMRDMGRNVVDGQFRGWVNGKLPGSPMPKVFDQGGWLQPGAAAVNLGDTPEPVLTDAQWRALSGVALSGGGGLSKADVDRIVDAIEANRNVYAPVSSDAELEVAFDAIGAELRKKGRG